jgi:hypothetical protein
VGEQASNLAVFTSFGANFVPHPRAAEWDSRTPKSPVRENTRIAQDEVLGQHSHQPLRPVGPLEKIESRTTIC